MLGAFSFAVSRRRAPQCCCQWPWPSMRSGLHFCCVPSDDNTPLRSSGSFRAQSSSSSAQSQTQLEPSAIVCLCLCALTPRTVRDRQRQPEWGEGGVPPQVDRIRSMLQTMLGISDCRTSICAVKWNGVQCSAVQCSAGLAGWGEAHWHSRRSTSSSSHSAARCI
ncbi:hypothetical protein MPTK2_2g21660 [Marchantia polymorpha subsp. ruderalis]